VGPNEIVPADALRVVGFTYRPDPPDEASERLATPVFSRCRSALTSVRRESGPVKRVDGVTPRVGSGPPSTS